MSTRASTQETATMSDHAYHFPFLKLPGELRNKVYHEVIRLDELPYMKLMLPKTAVSRSSLSPSRAPSTVGTLSTAWTLTQVNQQLRSKLLPLVHPANMAVVALCDLGNYLKAFYAFQEVITAKPEELLDSIRTFWTFWTEDIKLEVWSSRTGLHSRIPEDGVNLLPILSALEHIHDVEVNFHNWCLYSWELAMTHKLHKTFSQWRSEVSKLGLLDMTLRTTYDGNPTWPCGRKSSSLTLQCRATNHTSEKRRVLEFCAWIWKTGLRTLHERIVGLTITFVTPKTKRGQASEVKFSVFRNSVKMKWKCRGNYCLARLVDDKTALGFKVEKKCVEGKDVLRLEGEEPEKRRPHFRCI